VSDWLLILGILVAMVTVVVVLSKLLERFDGG